MKSSKMLPFQDRGPGKDIRMADVVITQDQVQLMNICERQQKKDQIKQFNIKQKLNKKYFQQYRKKRRQVLVFQDEFNGEEMQKKMRLSAELKRSFIGTAHNRSRSIILELQRPFSRNQTKFEAQKRLKAQGLRQNHSVQKKQGQNYSLSLHKIIQNSHEDNLQKNLLKRRKIMSLTQRNEIMKINYLTERQKIIDKMVQNDLKSSKLQNSRFSSLNPENRKKRHQQLKSKELKNVQKYNMSFLTYMKHKTSKNIQKSIYNEKIKLKDSYTEKFQDCILQEFNLSDQYKLRLQTIFKTINNTVKISMKDRKRPISLMN